MTHNISLIIITIASLITITNVIVITRNERKDTTMTHLNNEIIRLQQVRSNLLSDKHYLQEEIKVLRNLLVEKSTELEQLKSQNTNLEDHEEVI